LFNLSSQDYVSGVQNGSIAGTEGITFHSGDGAHDTDMDISSTLANLNLQLGRLHLGVWRGDCCFEVATRGGKGERIPEKPLAPFGK